MWTIVENAIRERVRRKEMFIVLALGILLMLLLSGDNSTLMVNGEEFTGYSNMLPIMHIIINIIIVILAVVLSFRTIPNEYSRRTSHLVWIRGISQPVYHGGLLIANCLTVLLSAAVLYIFLAVYMSLNGHNAELIRLFPAYAAESVNAVLICSLSTVLSIRLPAALNLLICVFFVIFGVFYEMFNIYKNIIGGIAGDVINVALSVIPNLHGIQKQAVNIINGNVVKIHVILEGLFAIYIILIGLYVLRRKEA